MTSSIVQNQTKVLFTLWKETKQKRLAKEAAAAAFVLARSCFLERQARVCAKTEQKLARYAEIADSGVADVAHAQERERIRFVDQQVGDSDYSDYDSDGGKNRYLARIAREALFMESRDFEVNWAREALFMESPLGSGIYHMAYTHTYGEDRRQRNMGSDDSDSDYDSPRVFHGRYDSPMTMIRQECSTGDSDSDSDNGSDSD